MEPTYFPDSILSQLGAVVPLATGNAALALRVLEVVVLSSEEEVFELHAQRRVAVVENEEARGDGADEVLIGEAVGIVAIRPTSIPEATLGASPQPAVAGGINPLPEPLFATSPYI
jgi:hypothetical protein